jgi:C-terminal processing protease CtpA/Prc
VDNGRVVLRSIQPDGPAAKAGLKRGDAVTAISDGANNVLTNGLGNGALNFLVTGKPNETVNLTVQTPGAGPRTVVLTREAFKPPTPRN